MAAKAPNIKGINPVTKRSIMGAIENHLFARESLQRLMPATMMIYVLGSINKNKMMYMFIELRMLPWKAPR